MFYGVLHDLENLLLPLFAKEGGRKSEKYPLDYAKNSF
jgi:hypothetical protein